MGSALLLSSLHALLTMLQRIERGNLSKEGINQKLKAEKNRHSPLKHSESYPIKN